MKFGSKRVKEFEDEDVFEVSLGDNVEQFENGDKKDNLIIPIKEIKTSKDMIKIIPFCNYPIIKDIARRPFAARVIFYLEEHGASSFKELNEALRISYGSLWNIFNRLIKKGFPIVKIRKQDQLNENFKYFDLKRPNPMEYVFGEQGDQGLNQFRQLETMLQELHKWYEYFALNAFMKYLPTYEWIELKGLDKEAQFFKLLKKWGCDFKEAIELLLKNEILYVKKNEDEITHIKRAFDNYGARIEEDYSISETEDEDLLNLFDLKDFFIE